MIIERLIRILIPKGDGDLVILHCPPRLKGMINEAREGHLLSAVPRKTY